MALGSTRMPWAEGLAAPAVGLSSAYRSRTPFACCSGTPFTCCLGTYSPPFDCTSVHVLCGGASVLRGGATRAPSSSDHSDITTLCVRVVWSPPSEMPPDLRGATPAVFLFLRAGSSVTALFPWTFSNTGGGDSPSDQRLCLRTLMRH